MLLRQADLPILTGLRTVVLLPVRDRNAETTRQKLAKIVIESIMMHRVAPDDELPTGSDKISYPSHAYAVARDAAQRPAAAYTVGPTVVRNQLHERFDILSRACKSCGENLVLQTGNNRRH